MKKLFTEYTNLQIYCKSRKKSLGGLLHHKNVLENKFSFVKSSPMFFLLPHLNNIGNISTVSLSKSVGNNTLLFSGKSDNIKELDYLKNQMCMQCTLLNIKQHKSIEVINTFNGGTYYEGNTFMFCFLPRKESIGFSDMLNVIDCLHLI